MVHNKYILALKAAALSTVPTMGLLGCSIHGAGHMAVPTFSPSPHLFNVVDYGAMGDGIADDGPAIERAMTAAAASGGRVTFPCGEFAVRSAPTSAPGGRSILYLRGVSGIEVVGQGSCSHLFTAVPQKTLIEFEDSSHISVSAMRLTALNARYIETFGLDGGSVVRFSGVNYGTVTKLEVDGASAGAIYFTKGTSSSSATNNTIHDTDGAGIWEDDCGASNNQNCLPSLPPSSNVYSGNTLKDTSLGNLAAINLDDGNGVSNAIVSGNTVSWTHGPLPGNDEVHCIQVNNASVVSVLNNQCDGTPWDAIVITTGPAGRSDGVILQGNILTSTGISAIGGSGIVVYDDPLGAGVSNFSIASNAITTAADDGIRIYAASKRGGVHDGEIFSNSILLADQRSRGSRFGIDIEYSSSITARSNTITCDGHCIAAGLNVNASVSSNPLPSANQTVQILGPPVKVE